MDLFSVSLQD